MISITGKQIETMKKQYRATLINSLPGYRSLHMVGTISKDGITNLALFNSVFHVGANPPLLGMVVRPDTPDHDTLNNIFSVGQYTLNNVLPEWHHKAHQASASYPSGISEFDVLGFKKQYINDFKAPFVKLSTIQIGLELKEAIDIKLNNTTIVIGEIVHIQIADSVLQTDGYVDHLTAGTITVAGLDSYFTTQSIGRLEYATSGRSETSTKNLITDERLN
jgi:flavin reductase (DIM6/NTAB) family NADH-FMN oxidoreductase RutF